MAQRKCYRGPRERLLLLLLPICVITILTLAARTLAIKVAVKAGTQECISQSASHDSVQLEAEVSFNVDAAVQIVTEENEANRNPRRYVAVEMRAPHGRVIASQPRVWQEAKLAARDQPTYGAYQLCFRHKGLMNVDVIVDVAYFTVIHAEHVALEGGTSGGGAALGAVELASHEHLTQVHDLVARIDDNLRLIKGEQRYIKRRLDRHLATNTSTHKRATIYALVEISVIFLLTAVQIATIHVMFRNHRSYKGILGR